MRCSNLLVKLTGLNFKVIFFLLLGGCDIKQKNNNSDYFAISLIEILLLDTSTTSVKIQMKRNFKK